MTKRAQSNNQVSRNLLRQTVGRVTASLLVVALVAPSAQAATSRNQSLRMKRSQTTLPQSATMDAEKKIRPVESVRPPRSGDFITGSGGKEAEYEQLLDQEINTLYKLSQQQRRGPNRGEIWLRLGERYVEKARLVEMREQAEYDKKLKDYLQKTTKVKPQLNQTNTREYNKKAVQLYEWFVKDFPKDSKVDQALFFLGYNQFELGNTKLGEQYYKELVQRFPNSIFVTESRFALGEYYFENEDWKQALEHYIQVIKVKKARLNTFALFKASWCLYRLGRVNDALKALERVVRMSRSGEGGDSAGGRKTINKVRLASEALKDYVPFYSEVGNPESAAGEFERLSGDEKKSREMLERLAYIYTDKGDRKAANYVFKQLIAADPGGEKAAEYQYQVVLAYSTSDQKAFRAELDIWLENFGPSSYWARQNAKDTKLVSDVAKLQETTLRNYVLQQHQNAQNSRAEYSQKVANVSYGQYFKHFSNSPKVVEMRFFQAELLFDMAKYEDAAKVYLWVADKEPQGQYREKSIINSVLALEKDLPSDAQIEKVRGKSTEKIPLEPSVQRFEKAAIKFTSTYPKHEKSADIQRRLGVLYYSFNHFEEATAIFEKLIHEDPKSQNAEIAGNLILDMYKLKGDMIGFTDKGRAMLANPAIASTKFGQQLKVTMEKATYMRAEKISEGGDSLKAAKEFEQFAGTYKQSDLAAAARFKAALAYEKGGDLGSAVRMHNLVLASQVNDPKIKSVQNDSRNALARIYQQTGQLEHAAKQYQAYAVANPKDQTAINAFYNAGVIWDGLGHTGEAVNAYQNYMDQSKRGDRHEVLYAQAEMHRRNGSMARAVPLYEKYLNIGPKTEAHAIRSAFLIGQYHDKRRDDNKARTWYSRTIGMQKSARQGKEEGARYAAEAKFQLAQETFQKLLAVRFGSSDREQARAAVDIKNLRERYMNEMKEVIKYDYAPYIVAALASTGQMFDSLAANFSRIPTPKGLKPDEAAQYRTLIQGQVDGLKTEAKNSYKAAVDRAMELETFTEWTQVARSGLTAHDPAASNEAGEIVGEPRSADWMGM